MCYYVKLLFCTALWYFIGQPFMRSLHYHRDTMTVTLQPMQLLWKNKFDVNYWLFNSKNTLTNRISIKELHMSSDYSSKHSVVEILRSTDTDLKEPQGSNKGKYEQEDQECCVNVNKKRSTDLIHSKCSHITQLWKLIWDTNFTFFATNITFISDKLNTLF